MKVEQLRSGAMSRPKAADRKHGTYAVNNESRIAAFQPLHTIRPLIPCPPALKWAPAPMARCFARAARAARADAIRAAASISPQIGPAQPALPYATLD